jgi:glycine cleavage system aminomethyltransferase T
MIDLKTSFVQVVVRDGVKSSSSIAALGSTRRVPVNLRQSGDHGSKMLISQRLRKSPYFHLSQEAGCWCYTTYNHMYHPRAYLRPEEGGLLKEHEYLTQHVTMWNVAVERQIQVKGPGAAKLVDMVITRSVAKIKPGRARYVILCNRQGGIINDPVLLRLAEDEFWFSLSDTDVGLYLQGVNAFGGYDCEISEIDVAPVQIQGPKSVDLMTKLFGEAVRELPYYGLMESELKRCKVVVSQTGFSTEKGYEIFLFDATENAETLWHAVLEAGEEFNLKVIAPGHIRRIEAGILSYGQDMDIETNPYQVGLDWQVDLDKEAFVGKEALQRIVAEGVSHKLAGIRMGGEVIDWYPADFYLVYDEAGEQAVGYITSAFYSPTQGCNIGYAMLPTPLTEIGTKLKVRLPDEYARELVWAEVAKTPFKQPEHPGTGLKETGRKL